MNAVTVLNTSNPQAARELLKKCCAAERWIDGMLARRPFGDEIELRAAAGEVWWSLPPDDWLEAFAAHPKIGDIDSLRAKYAGTREWSQKEQQGVSLASQDVLEQLASGNAEYEEKFGYIFIVCATGKTAGGILEILRSRLPNAPAEELPLAAAEQLKITLLRLEKLAT